MTTHRADHEILKRSSLTCLGALCSVARKMGPNDDVHRFSLWKVRVKAACRRTSTKALGVVVLTLAAILVFLMPRPREPRSERELAQAAARCDHRIVEGRLSGFQFRPYTASLPRSSANLTSSEFRRLTVIANEVLNDVAGTSDPGHLHQAGIAALLLGQYREALKLLESAIAVDSQNFSLLNDLAVVRYTAAAALDDPYLLMEALGAANRALSIRPRSAEANFNAALILNALGLRDEARARYGRCLMKDGLGSPWGLEEGARAARLRQPSLSDQWELERPRLERSAASGDLDAVRRIVANFPQPARTWSETIYLKQWGEAVAVHDATAANERLTLVGLVGDALAALNGETLLQETVAGIRSSGQVCTYRLAFACRRYYDARVLYEHREVAKSLPMFLEVEKDLAACRSPMREVAAYYAASALFDAGRTTEADSACKALLVESKVAHVAVRGQVLWTLANVQLRQGLLHQALSSQQESLALFRRTGEEVNTSAMERQAAGTLAVLGRRAEAWRLRIVNFGRISRLGDKRELQSALDIAARTEAFEERWDTAMPLLTLAADARLRQNPRVYASTLVWHALASQQLDLPDSEEQLRNASHAVDALTDATMRQRAKEDLTLVEAIGIRARDARRASVMLDRYIEDATTYDNRLFLPEAHLQRAFAARRLGDNVTAETHLREVLHLLADRRTPSVEQRGTYFRTGELATRELVDLLVRRGAVAKALVLLDDMRAMAFGLGGRPALPRRTGLLVEYLALADELLIFTVDARGVEATYVPVGEMQLKSASQQFVQNIVGGVNPLTDSRLEGWLIAPIAEGIAASQTVFIVPDRVIKRVPFGALRMPDGRYLIEHVEVVMTPTRRRVFRAAGIMRGSVVVVGAPLLGGPLSDLPEIPNAAHEARMVAHGYRKAVLLIGSAATAENVLSAARHASLLHFAVHAVVNPTESSKSYLALGSSARVPGMLSLDRVERAVLTSAPVVVLAGCRTADTPDRVPKAFSLADAFLAAGASTVVATLWDLPDDFASEQFSLSLHEQLRRGKTPGAAVRAAQLAMLHSPEAQLHRRSAWCVFQTYGLD